MIVVDTKILAYLLLPTPRTDEAESLYRRDPHWCAPQLWRSEFRNVLLTCLRKELLDLNAALRIQDRAEQLLAGREFSVRSTRVLPLAATSGCSAYDCEFVAVAEALQVPLFTADKRVLKAFPRIARALNADPEAPPGDATTH
ncbi:type II toxin-antitoxin system VapC family toxin [Thiohalocapsa marina]|uniref:Ribonuclease VapC n=1 Tax=Thiohalocapsa marina TaxID=424902 RepID=A0A5M8FQR7_9GAMM|nr:type II toxin-antitoxin system VapC family toxin [Thiohalocapsa marina]KAA6186226.1 type II toxin-antitoxin system VapC family toxin [Thiohalocapsa marina]